MSKAERELTMRALKAGAAYQRALDAMGRDASAVEAIQEGLFSTLDRSEVRKVRIRLSGLCRPRAVA